MSIIHLAEQPSLMCYHSVPSSITATGCLMDACQTSWPCWLPWTSNEPDTCVCQSFCAHCIQHLDCWYCANRNEVVLLFSKYVWTPKGIMTELGCTIMIKCGTGSMGCSLSQFDVTWWDFLTYNLFLLEKSLLALTQELYIHETPLICMAWLTLNENNFVFKSHAFPVD